MKNFDIAMEIGFDVLFKKRTKWPYEIGDEEKIELYEEFLYHFEDKQDYEKCNIINKRLRKVQNAFNRKETGKNK